jgi:hypothetical protein
LTIGVYLDGRNVSIHLNGRAINGGFSIERADVREMAGEILKVTAEPRTVATPDRKENVTAEPRTVATPDRKENVTGWPEPEYELRGEGVVMTAAMFWALQVRAMARIGKVPSDMAFTGFGCPAPGCGSDAFRAWYLAGHKAVVLVCAKCRLGRVAIRVADGDPVSPVATPDGTK